MSLSYSAQSVATNQTKYTSDLANPFSCASRNLRRIGRRCLTLRPLHHVRICFLGVLADSLFFNTTNKYFEGNVNEYV